MANQAVRPATPAWLSCFLFLAALALPVHASALVVCTGSEFACPPAGTCVINGTHQVEDMCVLDFGARDVQLNGTLEASTLTGFFTVRARNLTLNAGRLRSTGDSDDSGGDIAVELTGSFTMQGSGATIDTGGTGGAGSVDIIATSVQLDAGVINANGGGGEDCGDGGTVTIDSSGPVAIHLPINADTPGYDCDGGDIDVTGTTVTISRALNAGGGNPTGVTVFATAGDISMTSTGSMIAEGRGTDDESGNDGSDIDLSATGDIQLAGGLDATGSSPDGGGGFVFIDAGGNVAVSDEITVQGNGGSSDGGEIDISAGGTIMIDDFLTAKGGGNPATSGGGVTLSANGDIDVGATVDANGRSGGSIDFTSLGDTIISATVRARGSSGGSGGDLTVRGCAIEITGPIDMGSSGGGNAGTIDLTAGSITVGATASLQALPCGTSPSCITTTVRTGAPAIHASADVDPPHSNTVDPLLATCCGNGEIDAGETCDDGGVLSCDGCSRTCSTETDPPCPPDGNECTSDCSPFAGCMFQPLNGAPCSDEPGGNACTNDVCSGSVCTHAAITCDDGVACTSDSCNPASGCAFAPDDAACDDSDTCTADECSPASGCTYTNEPDDTPCSDGSICTTDDRCQAGDCTPMGAPLNCDDASPCTSDFCHPTVACVHVDDPGACPCTVGGTPLPSGTACADGNSCTFGDTCDGAGACVSGAFCNDGDSCTTDGCVFGVCVHLDDACASSCAGQPDGTPCSDGLTCTSGTCQGGTCATAPVACGDADPCNGSEFCIEPLGCRDSEPPVDDAACEPLDHFTCYKAKASGGASFQGIDGLSIEDEFGVSDVNVKKIRALCTPTDKNGEDPSAPGHDDLLQGYQIKPAAGSAPFVPIIGIKVVNQLGTIFVDAKSPERILVPTSMSPTSPPGLPAPPDPDHFKCYKIKLSGGSDFDRVENLPIEDSFGSLTIDLKKPSRLCSPASKDGEDPSAPSHPGHLVCYRAKTSRGSAKFARQESLLVANQFQAAGQLDALKLYELCIPSTIELP